jgi:fused signal recognition particle receptor
VIWIILAAAIVVVALGGYVVAARRAANRRALRAPRARAPLPTVLVAEPEPEITLAQADDLASRMAGSRGVFDRLRSMTAPERVSSEQLEIVEEVLLKSDVGLATATAICDELREHGAPQGVTVAVRAALRGHLLDVDRTVKETAGEGRVAVWLFVGVNGVGKTTTIAKLARRAVEHGHHVVLAAGDTFRAAAADQLELWAQRAGADIVRASEGADPGSVIHDALGRAQARGADLVLGDTAGRRHTSANLLDELRKIRRVADRDPGQVVETFLVLDATTGQNAVAQARQFLEAAQVTAIVLTKLDGTARGGVVVAIERELGIPVKLVGVGERPQDLMEFDPEEFVEALVGG